MGRTPVLLSLLILLLGAFENDPMETRVALPASLYELYAFAMQAAIRNHAVHVNGVEREAARERVAVTLRTLRHIAAANHVAQRRTFSLEDARAALHDPKEQQLWWQLVESGTIPLVKVLAMGHCSGEFQFKHLSFQEALFVQAVGLGEVPDFWATDEQAAAIINDAFFTNVFAIGHGHLGDSLARQRPVWDFSRARLVSDKPDRGTSRLQRLLKGATSLASLTLPLDQTKGSSGNGAFFVTPSDDEPASFFATALPTSLNRCFRDGRIGGVEQASLCARRCRNIAGQLLAPGAWAEPDVWETAEACSAPAGPCTAFAEPQSDHTALGQRVVLCDLKSRKELNGLEATTTEFDGNAERWAVRIHTTGEMVRVRTANMQRATPPVTRLPAAWFNEEVHAEHIELGCRLASEINHGATITLDQSEGTPTLLEALAWLRSHDLMAPEPGGTLALDAQHIESLLTPRLGGTSFLAALAAHSGSAPIVDALVRAHPAELGPSALVAVLRPGLTHNARRLLELRVAPSVQGQPPPAKCLTMHELDGACRALLAIPGPDELRPSAWHEVALDDGPSSSVVVDELLARCDVLGATVEELLNAALLRVDHPTVALRLATKHFRGSVDVDRLLAPSERGSTTSRSGGTRCAADDAGSTADADGPSLASTAWSTLAMREGSSGLVSHLLDTEPALDATATGLFLEAVQQRRYSVARHLFGRMSSRGYLTAVFDAEMVSVLLHRAVLLPADAYQAKKRSAEQGGAVVTTTQPVSTLDLVERVGPTHRARLEAVHSQWALLVLSDESNWPMIDELTATCPQLASATIEAEMLVLAMVPEKQATALWLLGKGAELDSDTIDALLEPSAAGNRQSSWQQLQLHPDCRRLVNRVMLSVPRLSSLDIYLCAEHAGRAVDLLESGIALQSEEAAALLLPHTSPSFLRAMSYDLALSSPGAIVHDSPHNYPDNADLRERFSIPGATTIYVAFHKDTTTENGYDYLRFSWLTTDEHGTRVRVSSPSYSGGARHFPGAGHAPVLEIPSDTFELRFVSDGSTNFWGYRFVAWAQGPPHHCRFAELMLHDSKDVDRLCSALIRRSGSLAAFAKREMVELSLGSAAHSSTNARAALAVLDRSGAELSDRAVDLLLRPASDGHMPWHKLLIECACPKLNERLFKSPRLEAAARSLELFLAVLAPSRHAAAAALLRQQTVPPPGLHAALVERSNGEASRWEKLVRDQGCAKLVRMLLSQSPSLTEPAILATLHPEYTYFYRMLARELGLAVGPATVQKLLAEDDTGAETRWGALVRLGPWPLVEELMNSHPSLREAATSHRVLLRVLASPASTPVALRLLEQGAAPPTVAELLQPAETMSPDGCRSEVEQQYVIVHGLPGESANAALCGLYARSHEEVGHASLSYLTPAKRKDRRCVWRQVGGPHALWFQLLDDAADDEDGLHMEHGEAGWLGIDGRAEKRTIADDGDDDDGSDSDSDDDDSDDDDSSGPKGDGDMEADAHEPEEPEEQDGSWVMTRSEWVGVRRCADSTILAQAADNAIAPNKVTALPWSVLGPHGKRVEVGSLSVWSASTLTFPARSTILLGLTSLDTCAPVVDALLMHIPALAPQVVAAALEAHGVQPYRRLLQRTTLAVTDRVIDVLLEPCHDGTTRWMGIVLERGKEGLVQELISAHPRLAAATMTPAMLVAAATPTAWPTATWLLASGAVVDDAVVHALCKPLAKSANAPAELHIAHEPDQVDVAALFEGRYVQQRKTIGGRPAYKHANANIGLWFIDGASMWAISSAASMGHKSLTRRDCYALLRGTALPTSGPRQWIVFAGHGGDQAEDVRLMRISRFPPPQTALHALVQFEECAPLVDSLLAHSTILRIEAVVAALEAFGEEPFRRLRASHPTAVDDDVVGALLSNSSANGQSRWSRLALQPHKRAMLEALMEEHPRLHALDFIDEAGGEEDADEAEEGGEEEEGGEQSDDHDDDSDDDDYENDDHDDEVDGE